MEPESKYFFTKVSFVDAHNDRSPNNCGDRTRQCDIVLLLNLI
ncbi:MAG: hypothetical protein RMY36_001005 [Nostoc sp. SerVER01]